MNNVDAGVVRNIRHAVGPPMLEMKLDKEKENATGKQTIWTS